MAPPVVQNVLPVFGATKQDRAAVYSIGVRFIPTKFFCRLVMFDDSRRVAPLPNISIATRRCD
jgi:hypothetical protein